MSALPWMKYIAKGNLDGLEPGLIEVADCLFAFCSSFSICFLMLNLQIPLNPVHLLLGLVDLQSCKWFCQLLHNNTECTNNLLRL